VSVANQIIDPGALMKTDLELITSLCSETESEGLDFKQNYQTDNSDLVHDILCLANANFNGTRRLVFGITDDKLIMGVQEDKHRRKQASVIDLIRNANFNILPTIKIKILKDKYGNEIDVLAIKNLPEKPYFLMKDFGHGKQTIRAGVVYSRLGDTNVARNHCLDDRKIEQMYRERFSIDKPPLQRLKVYLKDRDGWRYGRSPDGLYFYYELFPEFQIGRSERSTERQFDEHWIREFPDDNGALEEYYVRYHTTIIETVNLIWVDGGRVVTVLPKRVIQELKEESYAEFFFFVKDSLELRINEMIKQIYPMNDYRARLRELFPIISSFDEAKRILSAAIEGRIRDVWYYLNDPNTQKTFRCTGQEKEEIFGWRRR
jgi:hypothetical protein